MLFDWVSEANRRMDAGEQIGVGQLDQMLWTLGLETLLAPAEAAPAELVELAAERDRARDERDFERADRLRDEIASRGLGGARHAGGRQAGAKLVTLRAW